VRRDILEPVASFNERGARHVQVYSNGSMTVRLTNLHAGIREEWDLEVCEHPSLANKYDDGFRYIGSIPREIARLVIVGYLEDGESK
jgi:hypothetical protein